jgi:predicted GNAT family acetyltransferase
MRIERYASGASFLESAGALLLQAEAENNLILGVGAGLAAQDEESDNYLAVVFEDDRPMACAMCTPPHRVVVSKAPRRYLDALASDLADRYEDLRGVTGRVETAEDFAQAWIAHRPTVVTTAMSMRIYQLDQVRPPASRASGSIRVIEARDLDLLVEWMSAFEQDTLVGALGSDVRSAAQRRIDGRSVFIWEDDGPVSMAAFAGPTPNGIRINLVYTPPDLRGRGYASMCVATLSQHLLDTGRSFCFLYTDLGNSTSNRIYQNIGYRPVCDAAALDFDRPHRD